MGRSSQPADGHFAPHRRLLHRFVLLSVGFELERWGLGTRRALVGYRGERPLSRGEPGDGLATRRFSWIDEKELARSHGSALAARRRSPVGDAGGDAPLRIPRRSRRMAAVRSGVAPASW